MSLKSVRNLEKQIKRIMGHFSHSSFDPQPVITGIVSELVDYCVKPGLIIASSIINDIIGEFETECSLHIKKNTIEWWHKTFSKIPN